MFALRMQQKRRDSVLKRMKGLIGRSAEEFVAGKALWIVPSEGIHTFGMRFPIDAAYLDSKGKGAQAVSRD